jgi:NADH-quinone oxidoreductase subunit N
MKPDWVALLPLIFLSGGGFLILCIGAFWKKHPPELLYGIALITVFLAGDAAVFLPAQTPHFLRQLEAGGFGRYLTLLIALITGISLLFSHQYAKARKFEGDEFYGLILFAAAGMILVAGAIHWLTFFLGLEILSLSLYVIIAIRKEDAASNEAAIKYFVMGAVASAFLTFGIALIYAVSGELDIARSLAAGVPAGSLSVILLGFILVLVGIGFKISMVPFHLWTPDVYQGAPAPVTAFLSTGSKVALFAALLRFASYAGNDLWTYMVPVMWVLAFLTMAVGNVSAVAQYQVKRLLAYSSVAQMGYLLMALLAVKQNGAPAILFYLGAYALMDMGAFGTLATLSGERTDLDELDDFQGLAFRYPWRAAVLTLCLLSLAGLPPTAGFIGKFAIFWAVFQGGYVFLGVLGILTVMLSIYYYFKVIVSLFMKPTVSPPAAPAGRLLGRLAGGLVFFLLLLLGLFPESVFSVIQQALPLLAKIP